MAKPKLAPTKTKQATLNFSPVKQLKEVHLDSSQKSNVEVERNSGDPEESFNKSDVEGIRSDRAGNTDGSSRKRKRVSTETDQNEKKKKSK